MAGASRLEVLKAIGDSKSLLILSWIARRRVNGTGGLMDGTRTSHKEYYSRITRLIRTGIVRRARGKYYLTPFGRVICEILEEMNSKVKRPRPCN